jgi:5-methylcytosine-specific restriction endonuclease McrA
LRTLARHPHAVAVKRTRRARAARKRKLRMDRVVNDLTPAEWAALKEAWKGCAYCGATDGAMQRDCVMAISRGGRYTLDNVVPACASCNTSKCNDEVTGWMRRKRLDERTFLTRYLEIRGALLQAREDAPAETSAG